VHDDRVQRDFTAIRPDLVWLTDITEHPTLEGKLYCCAIKDVFSNPDRRLRPGLSHDRRPRRRRAVVRDRPPPT
jgi:transposase InsO family protein